MKIRLSLFPLFLALLLTLPNFAQAQFRPAPSEIKGLVNRHFSSISTADAAKFKRDIDQGDSWINDTLLYFKTNIALQYKTMQYNPQSGVVLLKMNKPVEKRMSHDALRDPKMQARLRQKGMNPKQYMAFKVKKVGAKTVIRYQGS